VWKRREPEGNGESRHFFGLPGHGPDRDQEVAMIVLLEKKEGGGMRQVIIQKREATDWSETTSGGESASI